MTQEFELKDAFDRKIEYLRLSVTDRCDFRCTYCMAENMTFLPREKVLSLEELATVAQAFRDLGVSKLRVTGGEPLIRKDVLVLFRHLGRMGFDDLSLTTNGSHLAEHASALVDAGVHRVNVSLDSLQPKRFRELTRHGHLARVLEGIAAARVAGFRKVKINSVMLRHFNLEEAEALVRFCIARGFDISFIEEMPLGEISSHARQVEYVASEDLRARLQRSFKLTRDAGTTGGPSRYWRIAGANSRIGFISPHSENFCGTCNRVRVSAEGRLLLCLGNEHSVDLRSVLRSRNDTDRDARLRATIVGAMAIKPREHHFDLDDAPQILRFMNATGG